MQAAKADAVAAAERRRGLLNPWWRGLRSERVSVAFGAWVTLIYGVIATSLYAIGRVVGDATGWLYVSNLATIYWLTPTVGLLAIAVAARWRLPTVACLLAAVGWLVTFGPLFVPQATPAASDLRVVSYNMQGDPDAPGVEHVARLVERTAPDVLLLQEVAPFSREPLIDVLSSMLPDHYFSQVNPAAPGGSGTGVFSRLPIRGATSITDLPAVSRPMDVVTLDNGEGYSGGSLNVVSLHLITPHDGCKSGDVSRCVTSFSRLTRDSELRGHEIDRIIASLPSGPLVVGGDLNSSTANSPRRRLLDAGLIDLHNVSGSGPGFTANRAGLAFRVDWLFSSSDVTAVREWVGPLDKSDHRPVVADVALPQPR